MIIFNSIQQAVNCMFFLSKLSKPQCRTEATFCMFCSIQKSSKLSLSPRYITIDHISKANPMNRRLLDYYADNNTAIISHKQ